MKFPFFSRQDNETESLKLELKQLSEKLDDQIDEELHIMNKGLMDGGSEPIGSSFGMVDEQFDKGTLQRLLMTETWFYIAVFTIAKTIASLPVGLKKKKMIKQRVSHPDGSSEEVYKEVWVDATGEPEFGLFKYPNGIQTAIEFWMLVTMDLLGTGDAFIYLHETGDVVAADNPQDRLRNSINRVRQTDIDSMFRLNSSQVEPLPSHEDDKLLGGYRLITNEGDYYFKPEEVIHLRLPNPADPLFGMAPIIAVLKEVMLDHYSKEHMLRFYKQGARLGGVIETEKKLTDKQLSRLSRTFESTFTGKRNHHRTLILPEGMKYKTIEQNPGETSLIEFMRANKEPILAAYNLPPIKVGLLDGATFANAMIQNKTFYIDTIIPFSKFISQGMNLSDKLLKPTRNLQFCFDFSEIEALQEDNKAKAEQAQAMAQGGLSINEIRERVWKVKPVEGGELIPLLASRQAPDLSQFLSAPGGDEKTDTANQQNDNLSLSDVIPTQVTFDQRVSQLAAVAIQQGVYPTLAVQSAIQQALEEGYTPSKREESEEEGEDKAAKIENPFEEKTLVQMLKVTTGDGVASMISERKTEAEAFFKRLETFIKSKIRQKAYRPKDKSAPFKIKADLPTEEDLKKFINEETDRISEALIKASKHGYKNNIPSRSLDFPNKQALDQLKKVATRNVKSVTKSSLKQLKNIITSSVSEPVSTTELASRIQDAFSDISRSKAETIARTETLTAVSMGQNLKTREFLRLFPQERQKLQRVWITARDEKVRGNPFGLYPDSKADHWGLDGEIVEIGKKFGNGLEFPRDPSGPAYEVINCRCSFVDFMPEDVEDITNIFGEDPFGDPERGKPRE